MLPWLGRRCSCVSEPAQWLKPLHYLHCMCIEKENIKQYECPCCCLQELYVSVLKYAAIRCAEGFAQK